jgi:ubiquinone/menaquinone biosynthesis C-methylase UbiE
MTEQAERYDRIAEGYEQWWAPVLVSSALALLDRVDALVGSGARDLVDVGTGTGTLAIAAVARWPVVRVHAIDASREMVASATRLADERLEPDARARLRLGTGFAAELPLADASADLVISSFVLQLVPSRAAALRDIRRVLRPGGWLAYVTWLADRGTFAPDRLFDALLDEFGFEDEVGDDRSGDVPSVATAANELRRASFREVRADGGMLEYAFTADTYLAFLTEFDEVSLFEEMARSERRRFLARLREGLMRLPPDDLVFRAPIVYATGRRPSD